MLSSFLISIVVITFLLSYSSILLSLTGFGYHGICCCTDPFFIVFGIGSTLLYLLYVPDS